MKLASGQACIGGAATGLQFMFGAMGYSAATRKAWIDPRRCYGCGICRSVCKPKAIELRERTTEPLAANRW